MSETPGFVDPNADFDLSNPIRSDAVTLTGSTRRGKACVLIDNTGDALPQQELQQILNSLIESDSFGFKTLSATGGDAIRLERRESSHVQIGENLYRLILYRFEARLEPF